MLAEAVIATRGVAAVAGAFGGGARHSAGSSPGGVSSRATGPFGGFLKGGLAGAVSRKVTRDAVRTATTATSAVNTVTSTAAAAVSQSRTIREQQADTIRQTGTHQETQTAQQTEMATAKTFQQAEHTAQQSATQTTSQASHTTSTVRQADKRATAPGFKGVGLGGAIFAKSLLSGGSFANDIIGTVARGDIRSTGSITGDLAAQSIRSYLGCAGEEASGKSPLTFSNVEIGGGRITGMVSKPGMSEPIAFSMYHADQYTEPKDGFSRIRTVDGTLWYTQLAQDAVERKPYKTPDDTVAYQESIVKRLPDPPKRKDRI